MDFKYYYIIRLNLYWSFISTTPSHYYQMTNYSQICIRIFEVSISLPTLVSFGVFLFSTNTLTYNIHVYIILICYQLPIIPIPNVNDPYGGHSILILILYYNTITWSRENAWLPYYQKNKQNLTLNTQYDLICDILPY